ncbi:nickel-responsive transcriptional regulator NikR [Ancylobacter sp.]|uniref:nickel-responsive transcriptional regulator NikR n=1 Tax=Ancylobacter sp. TaxID=1872567 RepID=UPI003D0CC334
MQRITIAIDDELAAELDAYMQETGATSRSEAIRDLVRRGLSARPDGPAQAPCFGVISCAIDQSVRNLASRVPQGRLDRHDQTVAALSVPLDHTTSIDVTVMRGQVTDISTYAQALFLERGVMHGALSLIPVAEDAAHHVHNQSSTHEHTHLRVKSGF